MSFTSTEGKTENDQDEKLIYEYTPNLSQGRSRDYERKEVGTRNRRPSIWWEDHDTSFGENSKKIFMKN